MKVLDRLAPIAQSLSLACLGGGLLWLSLSGRYASFVPPSARLGIIASGVGLLACSLALSARLGLSEHAQNDSDQARHALTRTFVALVASALIVLPFHVSPSELASTAWSARGADAGANPGLDAGNEETSSAPTSSSDGDTPSTDSQSGGASAVPSAGTLAHDGQLLRAGRGTDRQRARSRRPAHRPRRFRGESGGSPWPGFHSTRDGGREFRCGSHGDLVLRG